MEFKQIAKEYFQELRREVQVGTSSGEATNELSYRTSLDNFFKRIASNIDQNIATILEPRNQSKAGRPDWRFHDSESMGVYGYVEAKGLDPNAKLEYQLYSSQIQKYLVLGNPVMLTDGIDFVLFSTDGKVNLFSLCNKPIKWEDAEIIFEIESHFKSFFGHIGSRSISENQLVSEVAKRAKLLTKEIIDLLELNDDEASSENESYTLNLLKQLKLTAEINHDKSLIDNTIFAGFISQILTFGLLYAHRVVDNSCNSPKEKYERIHDFWFSYLEEEYSNRLIPFKTLVNGMKSELNSELSRLGLWYDDLRRLLSHIKLSSKQVFLPDFHELYETFLSLYDPKTRLVYGAFYTPRPLAIYIVDLVKAIIKQSIPEIDLEHANHKIIDPCCGTGTFIEAVLERMELNSKSNIIGFEILPAPYALAHYRIAMLKEKYPDNIKIILTNTLSDSLFEEKLVLKNENHIGLLLLQEQQTAYQLSSPPLTIIIGNPPSYDGQTLIPNEGKIITELLNDFRPPLSDRSSRQNTQKQGKNEFVKFLRWVVDRAMRSRPSVFALILPSSFAKHNSYEYARKYLAENISDLWVLNFDSDNRAGMADSHVFETLQGRLLLIGVLKTEKSEKIEIKYLDICGLSKQEKLSFFKTEPNLEEWQIIDKLNDTFAFKPSKRYDKKLYEQFWPLTIENGSGIFLRHCSSLKLAPTHLLVHCSKGQLSRRAKYISQEENNYSLIKETWYSGQRKPPKEAKITSDVRRCLGAARELGSIYEYSYRPFLEAYVILNEDLLNELVKLEGKGTRDRPEIRTAYKHEGIYGFAVAPAPEDIGTHLHKFSSFCWHIPDNDLSARGNAHVFCNFFPQYKKGQSWNPEIKSNINEAFIETLLTKFNLKKEELINHITFYSYALLSSNYFLNSFSGKLFDVAGEWPRIPVTSNETLFLEISQLGRSLAEIESNQYQIANDLPIPNEISYYSYETNKGSIKLFGDAGNLLHEYPDVDIKILDFEISGYNVLKEWLKMHSYAYYRKNCGAEEFSDLNMLISKIALYINTIVELDDLVELVMEGELFPFK